MNAYTSKNSGIVAYAIGEDYMDVQFKNGGVYRYKEAIIGKLQFLNMQAAALLGEGLNGIINRGARARGRRIRY